MSFNPMNFDPMKFTLRKIRNSIVLLSFTLISLGATASDMSRKPQVTVDPVQPVTIAKKKPANIEIRFHVAPGFHVNSNKPGSDLLIPTTVEFAPESQVKIGKIEYPAGKELQLAIAPEDKLNVYSGDVNILAAVTAGSATRGTYTVKGKLNYQACSDNACFPPKSLPLEVVVKVQ